MENDLADHMLWTDYTPKFYAKGVGATLGCFPMTATVRVRGAGTATPMATSMSSLRVGDEVLVSSHAGSTSFEPVLGFLHTIRDMQADIMCVTHENGEFRATSTHLVFTGERAQKEVGKLQVGDSLLSVSGQTMMFNRVLATRRCSAVGLVSPLTASGTVVVDNVVASIYAAPTISHRLTHSVAHAGFFAVRAYHASGAAYLVDKLCNFLCWRGRPEDADEMHPFARVLLKADFLLHRSDA